MSNRLLTLNHLQKNYHDENGEVCAISDLSFDIYDQEFICIVGPSGCGKSSLLSILSNLEDKTEGEVKFYKEHLKIGYMLQKDSLFPWLTIWENCLIGPKLEHTLTKEKEEKILHLLEQYGLKDFISKYPSSLSGGMRQRVALIRTLALDPDILLLDEPLSALDYQTRLALSNDLYRMIKEQKKTAIMVTHDLAEVMFYEKKIIRLR